jgi:hypothetical protein
MFWRTILMIGPRQHEDLGQHRQHQMMQGADERIPASCQHGIDRDEAGDEGRRIDHRIEPAERRRRDVEHEEEQVDEQDAPPEFRL